MCVCVCGRFSYLVLFLVLAWRNELISLSVRSGIWAGRCIDFGIEQCEGFGWAEREWERGGGLEVGGWEEGMGGRGRWEGGVEVDTGVSRRSGGRVMISCARTLQRCDLMRHGGINERWSFPS